MFLTLAKLITCNGIFENEVLHINSIAFQINSTMKGYQFKTFYQLTSIRLIRQFLGLWAIEQIKKAKQSTKRQDSQILPDFVLPETLNKFEQHLIFSF